ncbi:MAG: fused MFS/spermidine synthase [Solirubrobacterales bacterium]|nr:fused MFS/spermidine synthase [Solirubrobacterales bacterium]
MARHRGAPRVVAARGELIVERDPDRPSGRLLRQAGMEASYVDLADPRHLEFDYLRWMRIVLGAARARRVLHVGGAGCALARALAAADPDGRQEVCELDAEVLELARRHLGLRRARGLHVREADGRAYVARLPDASFQAVVIDAFLGARIPRALVTVEALRDVRRVAPLAIVNVVDDRAGGVLGAIAAGLREAYPRMWAVSSRGANTVLVGAVAALHLDRIAARAAADRSPARVTGHRALAQLSAGAPAPRDPER